MYLNPHNALQRLRNDWNEHGKLIVAVDYDSTLMPYLPEEYAYKEQFEEVRQLVRELSTMGCIIIIFTASDESRHGNIKASLKAMNIKWDLFNESPEYIPNIGKTGKVYANAYLDDRAGLSEVFGHLTILVAEKKLENMQKGFQEISKQLSKI